MCISNKKSKIEHNKIFVISTNTMTTFDLTLFKGEAITNIFYSNLISKTKFSEGWILQWHAGTKSFQKMCQEDKGDITHLPFSSYLPVEV